MCFWFVVYQINLQEEYNPIGNFFQVKKYLLVNFLL
nr:MAG TPA: hypothetical protein [Caudoviricetes sp.]